MYRQFIGGLAPLHIHTSKHTIENQYIPKII